MLRIGRANHGCKLSGNVRLVAGLLLFHPMAWAKHCAGLKHATIWPLLLRQNIVPPAAGLAALESRRGLDNSGIVLATAVYRRDENREAVALAGAVRRRGGGGKFLVVDRGGRERRE